MVQKNGHAIVIDPGEAAPVEAMLTPGLVLEAILITHHHQDHVGGLRALHQRTGARVYGPRHETLPYCDQALGQDDQIFLPGVGMSFRVLDIPGHTAGHIAYFGELEPGRPAVFCGDTLFAAGCGRLFEGTPAQMVDSLGKLGALPPDTLVCCAHEYTEGNLRWATHVLPDDQGLRERAQVVADLRKQGLPSVPSDIGTELRTNPFLRTGEAHVAAVASDHAGVPLNTPQAVFACLREWKNNFK